MTQAEDGPKVPWWHAVLFACLAGGMAWGIRGQYGHETGAMMAGLLVGLVFATLFCRNTNSLAAARAVAWCTVAMGFGGTMTYGQTLGLTQDAELVGNWEALRWGLLGCAVKGGVWIGLAGAFLGMGLGGKRYRTVELFELMLALLIAFFVGVWLFNSPFNPREKLLPAIYFSGSYYFWPNKADLVPRPESWGGLWMAFAVLIAYTGTVRRDGLAWRMALWGVLGGALGFPLGQSLQAYHAWNLDSFKEGIWASLDPHMNWWNMMETTFGATMGAVLGLGLWLHRRQIRPVEYTESDLAPSYQGWVMLTAHVALVAANFSSFRLASVYDQGLMLGLIPMMAIARGRWWPYMMVFPVFLLPIAGKTVLELVYEKEAIGLVPGWTVYFVLPLAIALAAAVYSRQRGIQGQTGAAFGARGLLIMGWILFLLNFAFFRFPWPWAEWTNRTPSGIIFTGCIIGLTILSVMEIRRGPQLRPTNR